MGALINGKRDALIYDGLDRIRTWESDLSRIKQQNEAQLENDDGDDVCTYKISWRLSCIVKGSWAESLACPHTHSIYRYQGSTMLDPADRIQMKVNPSGKHCFCCQFFHDYSK